jgi:hypothetical protein
MLVAEKYEQFVLGETKISQDAIAKARNDYRYQYARTPQLLRQILNRLDGLEIVYTAKIGFSSGEEK